MCRFVPLMHIISTKHRMSPTQHNALPFVALLPPNGSQSVPLVHPSLLRRQSVCGTAEGRVLQIELASLQRFLDMKLPGSRCGAKRAGSARIYSPVLQQTQDVMMVTSVTLSEGRWWHYFAAGVYVYNVEQAAHYHATLQHNMRY